MPTGITPTRAVLAVEADRYRAMVECDVDALRSMCDPKLCYVTSIGTVDTLDSWLEKVASGTFRYERIEHPVDSVDIRGDIAIVHGRMQAHGARNGVHTTLTTLTTSILVRSENDGHWRLLAFHATAAPNTRSNAR